MFDRALMALQGPRAGAVMQKIAPDSASMKFMTGRPLNVGGMQCFVTRSGYTGEDGFEISVPGGEADNLARKLLGDMEVKPIGLGARDSLRLEAGLCLYGNDITETTTPVEASLVWAIQKRRREQGGFPGAGIVQRQLAEGPPRKRVGILPDGKAPARAHTEIANEHGEVIGEITRRLRPDGRRAGRHGLCARRPRQGRHAAAIDGAGQGTAGEGRRHAVRAAPLSSLTRGEGHERSPLQQGP